MKKEIIEILDYMELGTDLRTLRDEVKQLDEQNVAALQQMLGRLQAAINHSEEHDRKSLGHYYLLLGCVCHAQGEYRKTTAHLKQALTELKGSKNNKAVGHWLLSVNYSSAKEFDKARKELVKAERLSTARLTAMQSRVDTKIKDMFNDPIFNEVPPIPRSNVLPALSVPQIQEQPVPQENSAPKV